MCAVTKLIYLFPKRSIVTHVMKVETVVSSDSGVSPKLELHQRKNLCTRNLTKKSLKECRQEIPENKNLAESRLRKQTERLQRDQNLMNMYEWHH